eukprot:6134897-Prymnesium_polylepis.1
MRASRKSLRKTVSKARLAPSCWSVSAASERSTCGAVPPKTEHQSSSCPTETALTVMRSATSTSPASRLFRQRDATGGRCGADARSIWGEKRGRCGAEARSI